MKTLISADFAIGFQDGDHAIVRDAEVVYEGERIEFVGNSYPGDVDRRVDYGRAVISPGFIDLDALSDIDHALIDSWQDPQLALGLQWSADYFENRRHDVFGADEVRFRREYALTHLIRNGVTTAMPIASEIHNEWAETEEDLHHLAEVARSLGLRTYLGPAYRSGVNVVRSDGRRDVLWDEDRGREGLEAARRFVADIAAQGDSLITGALLPCRIESMTKEVLLATAKAAEEFDVFVRLHAMQGPQEVSFLDTWYGRTPIEVLTETGLFNERLLIPHGVQIGGARPTEASRTADLERLAEANISIIHCPLASFRYGGGLRTVDDYLGAGINLAFGTDSFPADIIKGMDCGSNLAKVLRGRLDGGAAADYFRIATLGGARALGREDIGRLEPGALADIIVVDLSDHRVGPIDDPIRTMIMNTDGSAVRTSIINGRTVMEDRQIPDVDLDGLHDHVQEYFRVMKAGYLERDYLGRSAEQLFPSTFRDLGRPE